MPCWLAKLVRLTMARCLAEKCPNRYCLKTEYQPEQSCPEYDDKEANITTNTPFHLSPTFDKKVLKEVMQYSGNY